MFGYYYFENIPCGYYFLRAEYKGKSSEEFEVFISEGRAIHRDALIIPLYNDHKHNPVILVPGILGSTSSDSTYPTLPAGYSANSSDLKLYNPWGYPGWDSLTSLLTSSDYGYEEMDTIIPCPYDWRMPIEDAVNRYLIPCIKKAASTSETGKVDVIAHSMGGLLVRAYIQGDNYANDINKFAMVGTPNLGSEKVYYLWEGGNPYKFDDGIFGALIISLIGLPADLYSTTTEQLFYTMMHFKLRSDKLKQYTIRNFYNVYVPSIRQLLSTEAFLIENGSHKKISTNGNINSFLQALNSDSHPNRSRMGTEPPQVVTAVFAGTQKDTTIKEIEVQKPNDLYEDGAPVKFKDPFGGDSLYEKENPGEGDGTVLTRSALWPHEKGFAYGTSIDASHNTLISAFKTQIVDFLVGDSFESSNVKSSKHNQKVSAIAEGSLNNTISLLIDGRVQPYIVDSEGRGSGINPTSGKGENDVPNTTVSVNGDVGCISTSNPPDGTYTLYLKGIYNEDYRLNIGYTDDKGTKLVDYIGFNHASTLSFTFTINSSSKEKISINHTPLPPIKLQADAVDAGGLKTKLVWEGSSNPDVAGYNIYSREDDEPYLAQIGSTADVYYDTIHDWAENSSIKTRIYAVSAVKTDGTESFLSDMVENNDRDHDGLSDEKEVSLGTNVTDSDTDDDGLTDGEEYIHGTDPLLTDTDEDGYSDYEEIRAGSDPLDKDAVPTPTPLPKPSGTPTAITLAYFDARAGKDGIVTLTWETVTEVDNAGFNIYRSNSKNGHYTQINNTTIPAQGTAVSGASYSYIDTPGNGTFFYKLEDVDYHGVSTMHGPEKVRVKSGNNASHRSKKARR